MANQLVAAGPGDSLDEHDIGRMFEDGAVTLLQDIAEVFGGGSSRRVVLAHVAEPPRKLGDPLSIT
jgi:hypothetical protein